MPLAELRNEAALWISALVNTAVVGILALLAAWCFARQRVNAASRYLAWWAALAALVLAPAVGWIWLHRPAPASMPHAEWNLVQPQPAPPQADVPFRSAMSETPAPLATEARRPLIEFPIHVTPTDLTVWLAALWLAAIGLGAVRLALEFVSLRRIRSRSLPAGDDLNRRLRRWATVTGLQRHVRLALSDHVHGPAVLGVADPMIILPRPLADELTGEELDGVVLHELAHLQRRDDYARLLQRIIETLFCFHPGVLWLGRKLDLEREIACDDWVVAVTGQAKEYALCLTRVVELGGFRRRWALAAGAVESKSHLVKRIEHMLDRTRNRAPHASRVALLAAGVVAVLSIAGAIYSPAVLAFVQVEQDAPPPPPAAPAPAPDVPQPAPRATPATPELPAIPPPPPPSRVPAAAAAAPRSFDYQPAPPTPPARAPLAVPATPPAMAYAPFPAMQPPPPPPRASSDSRAHIQWRDGSRSLDLTLRGDVEFTDDDSDVKSISPGGFFILDSNSSGERRRYEVRADASGKLTRTFSVNGAGRSLEEARPWLAGTLPEIIRESGIGAGPRIQRILNRGGNAAAFREIALIKSDGSKTRYLLELLNRANLDDAGLRDTMRLARSIGSDGDRARLLIAAAPRYARSGLREPFYEAVDTMSSDGDRRRVLIAATQSDRDAFPLAARSAGRLSSDGDKAAVLIQIAAAGLDNTEARRAWFRAADTITSDGDRARALIAATDRNRLPSVAADAARCAARMGSDGDKARVLVQLVGEAGLAEAGIRAAYFEAANSIHSDGDRTRVLLAALGHSGTSSEIVVGAIQSAAKMSSDGDKARVLIEAAQRAGRDASIDRAIRDAMRTIGSDGDRRRVSNALPQSPGSAI